MRVHTYEKAFLATGGVLLVACLGALLYVATARGIHLPGRHDTIDPARVTQTPPFDEPGVRQVGPDAYEAVIIGRAWAFEPNEIRVPVGARVTFISTATDVIHGLHVAGTRVNIMLIPGHVSRYEYTFAEPGEHLLICHEFCGLGHHTMGGKVVVE